jgi:hypothetical protein
MFQKAIEELRQGNESKLVFEDGFLYLTPEKENVKMNLVARTFLDLRLETPMAKLEQLLNNKNAQEILLRN